MEAVEVQELVKRYDKVEALRGVSLTVHEGEMFALLGPNGAGKTTLFSILATLRRPTSGSARVLGHDAVTDREALRRSIGIVFQEPALDGKLSALDNLELMGLLYGLSRKDARQRAIQTLRRLGLEELADRPPQKLSGGQKRRLELARALIPKPRLLFLDEATLGLDVDARRSFWKEVRSFTREGRTVFMTTHYMEEAEVADRIALIDQGRIVALDTPHALKARLGGGVLLLRTEDDKRAAAWLEGQGLKPEATEAGLMLVTEDAAAELPRLLKDLPCHVLRAEVREPSLEDVFLALTGRGLGGENGSGPRRGPGAGGWPR
jgi:ABC-2 type transport system ATP-binding protein